MSIAQLKTRGRALRISKWCRTRRTNFKNFYRRTRRQNAPLLEFSIWRTATLPIDNLLRKRSTESVPSVPLVWECCAVSNCIRFRCVGANQWATRILPWRLFLRIFTLGLWTVTSVTFIKSANQCSFKLCLIVHLVAVWTLIYYITAIKLRSKLFCHIPRRSRSHLPNNHAQQLQAYSDHSASWWTDITTRRTRGTASWFPMSIEISF